MGSAERERERERGMGGGNHYGVKWDGQKLLSTKISPFSSLIPHPSLLLQIPALYVIRTDNVPVLIAERIWQSRFAEQVFADVAVGDVELQPSAAKLGCVGRSRNSLSAVVAGIQVPFEALLAGVGEGAGAFILFGFGLGLGLIDFFFVSGRGNEMITTRPAPDIARRR